MALDRLTVGAELAGYLDGLVRIPDDLADLYREMVDDPHATMMTHPELGMLLEVLVRATGGRAVLEIGTFVGTSAHWMSRGLTPGGRIDTLEADPARAERAEAHFARAGIAQRIRIHLGPAMETLPHLAEGGYDLCYVDADKTGYIDYLAQAVRLVRPGGLIVADNVLLSGRVALPHAERDESASALVTFTEATLAHPRLSTSVLTVGDGITLSVVT